MLYRVVVDGIDILDYTDPELVLLNPKLELEINTAGSLEFTMPPYHKYYEQVHILTSTIEVYEDDEMLWFGRPVEQTVDFYKQKRIYCEGPLSFFNDTPQMKTEYDSIQLSTYFRNIINTHNNETQNKDRSFQIGLISIDDSMVYRKVDYQSSYELLKSTCLDTVEGYFFFRRENGINYIDWVNDIPYSSNQPIQFSLNLLDYQSDFNATEFATCVFPLGKDQGNNQGPLTIASVNNGQWVLESDAINTYGRIVKFQTYSDISDVGELLSEARKYLENTQFNSMTIECSAADLHSLNKEYQLFKLGQMVHVVSEPHLVDKDYPISKINIQLDSAAKQITLGTIKRKTLTRIYKEDTERTPDTTPSDTGSGGGLDDWTLIPPIEEGEPVTAIHNPTNITVVREPNKIVYKPGEALDFTGIKVRAWNGNKAWNYPPKYANGVIPFEELIFSTKKAPNIKNFIVSIVWKYNGKNYYADLQLTTEGEQPGGFTPNITSANTEFCHLEGGAFDRHFTNLYNAPAYGCSWYETRRSIYSPLIFSPVREGVAMKCEDVRSPSYNHTWQSPAGQVEIDGVTYYYMYGHGLYTSYGGHVVSTLGPTVTATSIADAIKQALR